MTELPQTPPPLCRPGCEANALTAIALSLLARRKLTVSRGLVERIAECGPPGGSLPDYLEKLVRLPDNQRLTAPQWRVLLQQAEPIAEQMTRSGVELVSLFCADYPGLLAEINDPPPLLYLRGNRALLSQPQLAVVGSRNSGSPTLQLAQRWCHSLAAAGVTITSGLAIGVDGAAHRGALAAARPTVAVMATGIDRLYPARHCQLAEQIVAQGGVLVTEYPPGEPPLPGNFPRRNRIISGLSLAVWVVEAAIKSGTLVTARAALEQNRELLVLPGSVNNPLTRGCHLLLREGAALVESPADILALFGDNYRLDDSAPALAAQPSPLLMALGYDPASTDELAERLGWGAADTARQLAELELQGVVARLSGGWQRC